MRVSTVRNVNYALPAGVQLIDKFGTSISPHGNVTLEVDSCVATTYSCPAERVLFGEERDANPFLHLFESLWILAGRQDVGFVAQFNRRMADYSDDGLVFHAAYGHRLRRHFGVDQLERAIGVLRHQPDTRQVVLQIWSARDDLGSRSKDVPCNDAVALKIRQGALRMTVFCRSNDVSWGAYGANAVQFSMIQEYVASKVGVAVGPYTQISDSFHAYTERDDWKRIKGLPPLSSCPYAEGQVAPWPLMDVPQAFDADLARFLADPLDELADMFPNRTHYTNSFFWRVAQPMYLAWLQHKSSNNGLGILQEVNREAKENNRPCIDWLVAGEQWLARREAPVPGPVASDR